MKATIIPYLFIQLILNAFFSTAQSTTDIPPPMRADIARNISVQHIDQLAIQYLGFTSDEMDEIRHDKPHGLDVIREVIRW